MLVQAGSADRVDLQQSDRVVASLHNAKHRGGCAIGAGSRELNLQPKPAEHWFFS